MMLSASEMSLIFGFTLLVSYLLSIVIYTHIYYNKYNIKISFFKGGRIPRGYYEKALVLALKLWVGLIAILFIIHFFIVRPGSTLF